MNELSMIDFDDILDARHGKVGTPEREQFRKEAESYCLKGKISTKELFRKCVADIPKELKIETDLSFAVSDKIAEALEKKGWSVRVFAKEMGTSPAVVSRWLSGTHNFTIRTIAKISTVLEIDILK